MMPLTVGPPNTGLGVYNARRVSNGRRIARTRARSYKLILGAVDKRLWNFDGPI